MRLAHGAMPVARHNMNAGDFRKAAIDFFKNIDAATRHWECLLGGGYENVYA